MIDESSVAVMVTLKRKTKNTTARKNSFSSQSSFSPRVMQSGIALEERQKETTSLIWILN